MAFFREGITDTSVNFAEIFDYEKQIKTVGFKNSAFYSMIKSVSPTASGINIAQGHTWWFDKVPDGTADNAHAEGSEPAAFKAFHGESMTNHYQITKTSFGVSGTELKGSHVSGETKLAYQRRQAQLEHTITLEKILLSDQQAEARKEANGYVGKSAGLKSFLNVNTDLDMGAKDLSWDHILELLKIGYLKGGSQFSHIMMNSAQKDALDKILFNKTNLVNMKENSLGWNVMYITNTAYGSNIAVILNPYLNEDEIIAFKQEDIFKVNWRPMRETKIPTSKDVELYQIISEFTLRVSSPFSLARLKNLKH